MQGGDTKVAKGWGNGRGKTGRSITSYVRRKRNVQRNKSSIVKRESGGAHSEKKLNGRGWVAAYGK